MLLRLPTGSLIARVHLGLVVLGLLWTVGCGETPSDGGDRQHHLDPAGEAQTHTPRELDHTAWQRTVLDDADAVDAAFTEEILRLETGEPFRQVGFMFDSPSEHPLRWRPAGTADTAWRDLRVTWSEDGSHVGLIVLEVPVDAVELRRDAELRFLLAEFYPHVLSELPSRAAHRSADGDTSADASPEGDFRTVRQKEAPRSLVIPREQWGSRHPNKKCGRPHNPYRMTIHHTASPSNDGGDPARRMRQMQRFHIDSRGWCDIGYHFVVSQSGKIYQGRSTEKRTGAHVGGQNTGNIGISLIGNFQNQQVRKKQFDAAAQIVEWVHSTYGIPLTRSKLKGHTEWPGQSTSCPGTNLRSRLKELIGKAKKVGGGGGGTSYDVNISVAFTGLTDRYRQGNSNELGDTFPGETVAAEILITNRSDDAIQDVSMGYAFQTPYLTPTSYTIYSDHPKHDRKSWKVNDADMAAENPDKSKMGAMGNLTLYAFSPKETKRVVVELKAGPYSLGKIDHPDVRAWVRHIDGVYETKKSWGDGVSTDQIGKDLRAYAQLDILSRQQWLFDDVSDPQNLEGWKGCCAGDYDELVLNQSEDALALHVTGPDARVRSPSWTTVDAETFDQMVLRLRAHDGPHDIAVWWAGPGEDFESSRVARFRGHGDGQFHTYVLPLGRISGWSGQLRRLRIDPLYGREPSAGDKAWYDIDAIYFQSSSREQTNTDRADYSDEEPVDVEALDDKPGEGETGNGGTGSGTGGQASGSPMLNDPPGGGHGDGAGSGASGSSGGPGQGGSGGLRPSTPAANIEVNEGCSIVDRGRPFSPTALLMLVVGWGVLRRKRSI